MKIGIIAPLDESVRTDQYGGTERIIGHLADGLVDRGHEVTLFATANSKTKAKLVGTWPKKVLFENLNTRETAYSQHYLEILKHSAEFDLWSNHVPDEPLSFAQTLRAPMVTTIHSMATDTRLKLFQAASETSSFIAVSRNQQSTFPGVRFADMIYNGTDPKALPLGDGSGGYFVWLGRFSPVKGAAEAVQIAKQRKVKLLLAGELPADPRTPDWQYFEANVRPHLSSDIKYVGRVDVSEKAKLLGEAIALVSPLSWEEPFGLVATEAMSTGTPVLTTRRGAMPELIVEGKTGYLDSDPLALGNYLTTVADLDRDRIRQHVIDNFSVDRMADHYAQTYGQVANAAT